MHIHDCTSTYTSRTCLNRIGPIERYPHMAYLVCHHIVERQDLRTIKELGLWRLTFVKRNPAVEESQRQNIYIDACRMTLILAAIPLSKLQRQPLLLIASPQVLDRILGLLFQPRTIFQTPKFRITLYVFKY